jgi:hypothetical protein
MPVANEIYLTRCTCGHLRSDHERWTQHCSKCDCKAFYGEKGKQFNRKRR